MSSSDVILSLLLTIVGMAQVPQPGRAYRTMLNAMYKKTVPTVSVSDVKTLPDVVLLDTRSKAEYEVSHLPGARWVGYDEFDLKRVADIPKGATIVTYCSVGVRSERVGEKLLAAGYQRVHNLYGSLFEWVNEGNPVVDKQGKPTQRVHGYSRLWGIWLKKGDVVY